jgi:hypothetical protein
MIVRTLVMVSVIVAAALSAVGCKCPECPRPRPYDGPIEDMRTVIGRINENNRQIPTLYAQHYLEANIVDPKTGKKQFINSGGDLFVLKPRDLLLRGKKDPVGLIFEMGSTADRYWFTAYADQDTQWWGHHKNAGKPCVREMPVRPDLVGEVLGIGEVAANLLESPAPTMRFNNDWDCYMITWASRGQDQWYAEREIWYDRATFLPRNVILFDRKGAVILRAHLTEHKAIESAGGTDGKRPMIATNYDLYFPQTKSTMTIRLTDVALSTKNGNPKPGTIRFPEDPGVQHVIQIDEDCDK